MKEKGTNCSCESLDMQAKAALMEVLLNVFRKYFIGISVSKLSFKCIPVLLHCILEFNSNCLAHSCKT